MESTVLPASGLTVSRLGFGGCPLGGHGWGAVDEQAALAAVRTALDAGIDFFDTADVYGLGRSEQLLSEALGDARHDVVIATKFGVRRTADGKTVKDVSPAYLRTALEASLKRLQVEQIPLYYLHWPDGVTPIEETVGELERCRAAGKIGAIGLSNVSADELRRAARAGRISAVQVQYSLVDRGIAESLDGALKSTGAPLVTWGSLAQGLLTGKYHADSHFGADDRRSRYENFQGAKFQANLRVVDVVQQVARELGVTPSQVAMRWLLDAPHVGCVLFGAKNPQQVQDNLGALGWSLPPAMFTRLSNSLPTTLNRAA